MKPSSYGMYYYLPLLQRSIDKASSLISHAMQRVDAQKITIPILTPANVWRETGRFSQYEDVLFLTKDKENREFVLGPVRLSSSPMMFI